MRRLKVTRKDKKGRNTFLGKKKGTTHCPQCGEKLSTPAHSDSLIICFKKPAPERCTAMLDNFQCKHNEGHEGMHEIQIYFNTPRHPWI